MLYLYGGLIGILGGVVSLMQYAQSGKQRITISEAKSMIKSKMVDHVVDVRTRLEWNMGHYRGAKHVPRLALSQELLNKKKIKKNDVIIVYCNTGQRARMAAEHMKRLGYKKVYYISESYLKI